MFAIFTYCMLSLGGSIEGCTVTVQQIHQSLDCDQEAELRMDMVVQATPEIRYTGKNYLCMDDKAIANSVALGMGKRLDATGRPTSVETLP